MGRAFVRGTTGEILSAPVRAGAQYVARAVRPAAEAAAELAPTLTREVPAAATVARVPVDELLQEPTQMAARLGGWNPSPEARNLLLGRWWQTNAGQGGEALGQAWDALGEAGQRALAGEQHGAMTTLVNAARGGGAPLSELTMRDLMTTGGPAAALWYMGHPKLAATVGGLTYAGQQAAPALLRTPGGLGWFGQLPRLAPLAGPFEWTTRAGGQYAANQLLP